MLIVWMDYDTKVTKTLKSDLKRLSTNWIAVLVDFFYKRHLKNTRRLFILLINIDNNNDITIWQKQTALAGATHTLHHIHMYVYTYICPHVYTQQRTLMRASDSKLSVFKEVILMLAFKQKHHSTFNIMMLLTVSF